jgi:hypothetical protein
VQVIDGYLSAERDLGRLAADADIDVLALTLIGASRDPEAVARMVTTVLAGATARPGA